MKLIQVIHEAASAALGAQGADGAMPAGHNGPYHDPETPVRNTAHWLVTFAFLAERDPSGPWQSAARRALDFLLSSEARPHGHAFVQRAKAGKDRCNGLIGAAWVFEGLAAAGTLLADDAAAGLGEDLFLRHPFDADRGLWKVYEIDGRVLDFDATFNHQLWFAAGAAQLRGPARTSVLERVGQFLDRCEGNLVVKKSGLIHHAMPRRSVASGAAGHARALLKDLVLDSPVAGLSSRVKARRRDLGRKSVGYHAFNLYAFALLRRELPQHPIWASERMGRMLGYARSAELRAGLAENPYAYPYNPPGFELPFAFHVHLQPSPPELAALTGDLLAEQLKRTLDSRTSTLARGNPDPVTLTARLYEATRLPGELQELELDVAPIREPHGRAAEPPSGSAAAAR